MDELKLVTFLGDNTQFLVYVPEGEKQLAIQRANEANKELGNLDDDGYDLDNYEDDWYEVEDIDFELLRWIFKRNDYIFSTAHAIVFND